VKKRRKKLLKNKRKPVTLEYVKLTVTTLNLQGFNNWEQRRPDILNYLQQTDADIIVFQEVVYLPELSVLNQVQLLNQDLRYPSLHSAVTRLQVGIDYPVFREGLAFVSKHPVVSTDTLILKQEKGDEHNRIIQLIDLLIDGQIVKFANVHFSITDYVDYATAHFEETLELLKARGETRIIIGDYNLSSIDGSSAYWKDDYSASTIVPYISFPDMNKRIDYALIPLHYQFESIVVSDEVLTDHRALTVTVKTT